MREEREERRNVLGRFYQLDLGMCNHKQPRKGNEEDKEALIIVRKRIK
jgi:hypothetical protein